jgi:hypothetical protein
MRFINEVPKTDIALVVHFGAARVFYLFSLEKAANRFLRLTLPLENCLERQKMAKILRGLSTIFIHYFSIF